MTKLNVRPDEGSVRHVCGCCGLQAVVCQYLHDIKLRITLSNSTDNMCAQYLFDDEVKEGAHGAFTPAMMQLSQVT
jgi:hypothetical protein